MPPQDANDVVVVVNVVVDVVEDSRTVEAVVAPATLVGTADVVNRKVVAMVVAVAITVATVVRVVDVVT